jgi:type IV secretory pathway VirB10-like protein
MLEYRAYLIGGDGLIMHRVDMLCEDDEAAKERALLLVDGNTVELWQGARLGRDTSDQALNSTLVLKGKTNPVGVLVLVTGIRSDLPGQVMAHVTESVFDTLSGQTLLVPQGTRLMGIYDSRVTHGQSRVLLVWTRLIMPNGRSVVLERLQGADSGGYAGLEDEVDQHWGELSKAALLSTVLGVGAELGAGADAGNGNSTIIQALRRGAVDSLNQTGQQVVRRNLNIQPTLTIRPGFPVRVMVTRDLVLEPYKG